MEQPIDVSVSDKWVRQVLLMGDNFPQEVEYIFSYSRRYIEARSDQNQSVNQSAYHHEQIADRNNQVEHHIYEIKLIIFGIRIK